MVPLQRTRRWLHAGEGADWNGSLYQYANRLAPVFPPASCRRPGLARESLLHGRRHDDGDGRGAAARRSVIKKDLGFPDGTIPWAVDVLSAVRNFDRNHVSPSTDMKIAGHKTACTAGIASSPSGTCATRSPPPKRA